MRRIIVLSIVICLVFVSGCESLRKAPTEPQKQIAFQAVLTARDVEAEGTSPGSPAAELLADATQTALTYTGVPANPKITDYPTTLAAAQSDAAARPTVDEVFESVEGGLSLFAELAILFGVGGAGFGGKKLLEWIALARAKNTALKEIIEGNEILKRKLRLSTTAGADTLFGESQNITQSPKTKVLVTELINS